MKKTKKGFTIVELIIVIAVIAVLTAILVPTFIHLTKKANEAADHSLVTNLNKALAMREAEEGDKGKNNTMYDCVMDLEKEGYKLPQLATRSDEDLVWSQKENRFFLSSEYNAEKHGGKYNCWHIYKEMPTTEEWGIYPNEDEWKTSEVTVASVGFDAGKAGVGLVKFKTNANIEITVRTNGGDFTVDAPNATVNHYADVYKVTIDQIEGLSYHEFGRVMMGMQAKNGHVVVEPEGYVNELNIPSNAEGTSILIKDQGVVNTTVNDSSSATVEVQSGAQVNTYVGSTTNVSGSGAQEVKDKAITKKSVTNEGELVAALAADKYVVLANDIEIGAPINFTRSLTLDGQGNAIVSKSDRTGNRIADVTASNVEFVLKNITLDGLNNSKSQRGLNLGYEVDKTYAILDNVTIKNAMYAINVPGYNTNLRVRIDNSDLSGWAALNCWSDNYLIEVTNSVLTGTNNYSGTSNSFGTVVCESDVTGETNLYSSRIKIRLVNTTIKAIANTEQFQTCFGFWSGAVANTIEVVNCDLVKEGDQACHLVVYNAANNFIKDGKTIAIEAYQAYDFD